MTLVFGASTRTFSDFSTGSSDPQAFQDEVNGLVLYFVYLFVGRLVINYIGKLPSTLLQNDRLTSFVGTLCVCIAATRTTNSLRKAFVESVLRKEIAYFDRADNGSTAAQVATSEMPSVLMLGVADTRVRQTAIGSIRASPRSSTHSSTASRCSFPPTLSR